SKINKDQNNIKKAVSSLYDEDFSENSHFIEYNSKAFIEVARFTENAFIDQKDINAIINIGGGTGLYFEELAHKLKLKGNIVNLDISKIALKQIKESRKNSILSPLHADAEHLPFKNNSADGVICSLAISFFSDPYFAIKEIERILAPKRKAVIIFDHPTSSLTELMQEYLISKSKNEQKFVEVFLKNSSRTKEQWMKMLDDAGLKVEKSQNFYHINDFAGDGILCHGVIVSKKSNNDEFEDIKKEIEKKPLENKSPGNTETKKILTEDKEIIKKLESDINEAKEVLKNL
ncbi:MAG: methyltransferase domain-containing protein, partial [Candidatus Aenigmarchaeota archaeon]|nr:methyltransferase domain-containing protein [Candidatus Aenigmarchaeota archaeon]